MSIKMKRFLGILLSLALVLGLMPGMSLTAYAATDTYTNLIPKDNDTDLSAKQVTFNGYKWYIIADNSTAANAGSVTLLAAESMETSAFRNSSGSTAYIGSAVKDYLDGLTTGEGSFAAVADVIKPVTLTTYKYQSTTEVAETIENAKLYLLSIGEARALPVNVRKCSAKYWWLRSPGHPGYPNDPSFQVATVEGNTSNAGNVYESGEKVIVPCEIRPALQLDLSKVVFDSTTKEFSLLKSYPLWVGGTQVTSANADDVFKDGKVKYTPAKDSTPATLTLNNYTYTGIGYKEGTTDEACSAIYYTGDDPLTIQLSGANSITRTGKSDSHYGDSCYYGIHSTKCAGLTITGSSADSLNVTCEGGKASAIYLIGGTTLTIQNINLAATTPADSGNSSISCRLAKVVNGAIVTAMGGYNGISADVEISENSSVIAAGNNKAIGYTVKNAITGTGWTNKEGTEGEADIAISTDGQTLTHKKVQFPGVKKFTITFNANGGTGTMEPQAISGNGGELNPNAFTRSGQVFTEWNTKADGTGDRYFDGGYIDGLTSDITLYAQWIEPNVKVGAVFKAGDTMKFAAKTMYVKPSDKIWDTHGTYTVTVNEIHDDYASMSTLYSDGMSNPIVGFTPVVTGANCIKVISGKGTEADPYILELGVAKDAAVVTKAPTAKDLTYTGSAQELVTAGTADGGTMQYALGTDATTAPTSGWSESIPKGTDAGTYYVWYMAKGDETHTDSEPKAVTVAIAAPAQISVTVTFKVVHGAWGDETREDKTVVLTGNEGDELRLEADQIPNVTKPDEGYEFGSGVWTPEEPPIIFEGIPMGDPITEDTTYTYTYGEKGKAAVTAAPAAKELVFTGIAQELVTAGTADGGTMQYALGTDATTAPTSGWSALIPTGTEAGTYYVWYKAVGDENHNDSAPACVTAVIKGQISATVTFKVVNGSWNDGEGEAATADRIVTLTGKEGDVLKLTAEQIPAVGAKPSAGYKAGAWNVTPSTETEIKENTTFIYTYLEKAGISATVTFKVVNGSWNDGEGGAATSDRTVVLTGKEGDVLKLTAEQIPAVGAKPGEGYQAGAWDVTPSTETEIKENTTFIYTYAAQKGKSISYTTYEGEGGEYKHGSDGTLTFVFKRSEADSETFARFTGLKYDGRSLTRDKDYTVKAGSVIITLDHELLESMMVGNHILTAVFDDGEADAHFTVIANAEPTATPTVTPEPTVTPTAAPTATPTPTPTPKPVPKTGDNSNPALWLAMMILGLAVLAGTAVKVYRKRQ